MSKKGRLLTIFGMTFCPFKPKPKNASVIPPCRRPGKRLRIQPSTCLQIRPIGRPHPHGRRRCLHLLYPATAYYATNSWLSIEPPWCAMPTYAESTVYSARIRANIAIENTPFPSRSEHSAHFPPADLRRPASRSQGQRRWV